MKEYSISDQEAELLDTLSDDVYGFWEVDWWCNSHYASMDKNQRIQLLAGVAQRQLVDVFFGRMGHELPPLSEHAALTAILDWQTWTPRHDVEQDIHHVITNECGLAALRLHVKSR